MKKVLKIGLLIISLALLGNFSEKDTFAKGNIKITALGKPVKYDVAPFVLNGRTMVPIRQVAESLGSTVEWSPEYSQITIERPYKKQLVLTLDNPMQNSMGASNYDAEGDGYYGFNSYSVYLDVAPVIRNGRTFLPARIIAEELGFYVKWDAINNTVIISENYLGGQTYKDYLKSQSSDPYQWSPYLKDQFEREMLESGYIESRNQLKYEKSSVINGEGYYTVYVKYDGKYSYLVGVNVKTGYYHG